MMAAQASTSASTNGRIVTGTYSPDRRRGPSTSAMGSRRAAVVERRRWNAWAESNASMIVSAGTVLAPDRDLSPGYVVVEEGRIVRVAAGTPAPDAPGPAAAFPDGTLIPGLIDLQVNGGAGVDCLRCGPEGYEILGRYLAATGVTAYLPTIVSAPLEEMRRAAACAGAGAARRRPVPQILGVDLEGPYLNPLRRGALGGPQGHAHVQCEPGLPPPRAQRGERRAADPHADARGHRRLRPPPPRRDSTHRARGGTDSRGPGDRRHLGRRDGAGELYARGSERRRPGRGGASGRRHPGGPRAGDDPGRPQLRARGVGGAAGGGPVRDPRAGAPARPQPQGPDRRGLRCRSRRSGSRGRRGPHAGLRRGGLPARRPGMRRASPTRGPGFSELHQTTGRYYARMRAGMIWAAENPNNYRFS